MSGYMSIFKLQDAELLWFWSPIFYVCQSARYGDVEIRKTERWLVVVSMLWLVSVVALWKLISKYD